MKKLIITIVLVVLTLNTVNAQIKNPVLHSNVKVHKINPGVKINNIKNISTADLHKLKLPIVSITEAQKNAKPLKSWKITPMRLKDTYLEVSSFFGRGTKDLWEINSFPYVEGREVTKWHAEFLWLKFRQSQNIEYRMKIKLPGNNYRGSQLYIQVNDFGAKYPVDPNDGTVNVTWTGNRSTPNASIAIGQFVDQNTHHDQRQPYQTTRIEYVLIDKISKL